MTGASHNERWLHTLTTLLRHRSNQRKIARSRAIPRKRAPA
jgi:hypothetical protein